MSARSVLAALVLGALIALSSGGGDVRAAEGVGPSGVFEALQVTTGWQHGCLLELDGTAKCWGQGVQGQTGAPAGQFQKIEGGAYHTCAITTGGQPVCWGNNSWMESTPPVSGTFIDVSADYYHTCLVDNANTATCWGLNPYGETNVPAGQYTQVSIGSSHACGLKTNNTAICWGLNDFGQSTAPSGMFKYVGAGNQYSCGIRSNDTIECWGRGDFNQTASPGGTFKQLDVGGTGSCAISMAGSISCWGSNVSGENFPPDEGQTYTDVSRSGQYHACAVRTEGSLVCWGTTYPGPQPYISPSSLPGGVLGVPYDRTLTGPPEEEGAGRPPYTFELSDGALPDGLSLTSDGEIAGTPTVLGGFTFEVRMDDSLHFNAYKEYTVVVSAEASLFGDVNCNGSVGTDDGIALVQDEAGLPYDHPGSCPDIGAEVASLFGDVDCDDDVDAFDGLWLFWFAAELSLEAIEGCPAIGDQL